MTGIRINELRLAGSAGTGRTYGAQFRLVPGGGFRPLSIIAGPSLTGKSSIVDYIRYCLGDSAHPQHEEVIAAVRAAILEAELDGQATVIERTATGDASKFASVWASTLANIEAATELRISAEPPSDPDGLSQLILAACNLDGIELPNSSVKEETATQLLSVRDLFNVMFVPNERLDNNSLVFEQANFMVRQKFRQTIDAMFGVHDNEQAVLADRYRTAREAARAAELRVTTLRQFADEEHPRGPLQLAIDLTEAVTAVATLQQQLASLDQEQRSTQRASTRLRDELLAAQDRAKSARIRVRDRRSLVARLDALRGQYADDKRKLNFLLDAERLFDPLHVVTCPACFNPLGPPPSVETGTCSLCHSPIQVAETSGVVLTGLTEVGSTIGNGSAGDSPLSHDAPTLVEAGVSTDGPTMILEGELRAVSKRLSSLNEYVARLSAHLRVLEDENLDADEAADLAAQAVDAVTATPAPWLALRDNLTERLSESRLAGQAAQAGVTAWNRVAAAEANFDRLDEHARNLNAQRRDQGRRPDRAAVISALSARFGEILRAIDYPKLSNPYIADDLIPHVRNLPYTAASSGGKVVIGLAWYLSLWEVAHEQNADAPGLLVIDSPQKNLGHNSKPGDNEFADATLVENFYAHVATWLAQAGAGAQLILVDNSPPSGVSGDVVVRFTRDPNDPPYGLIPEATQ